MVKYLIVLSLLLASCRDFNITISDIMQASEEEYDVICTPLNKLPNRKLQCLHDSMFILNPNYASCYNTAMSSSTEMHQPQNSPYEDEFRQSIENVIIDCADSRANTLMTKRDVELFIRIVASTLETCNICIEGPQRTLVMFQPLQCLKPTRRSIMFCKKMLY